MISNEEMYEFASQIAGITNDDLLQYKCGGKTKNKKMTEGGKTVTQVGKTKRIYDSKKGVTTETKTWSDGTTSSRSYDDDNEGITYRGRKGEMAVAAGNSLKADSLLRADWSGKSAPALKSKTIPTNRRKK